MNSELHSCEAVHGYVGRVCFKTGPPQYVGAELEWLVADPARPRAPVPLDPLRSALAATGPPPAGSRLTFEPGGQLELSSPPATGLSACVRALRADLAHVVAALRREGLVLVPVAVDPYRTPLRQVAEPRYDAMEAYFDHRGRTGRVMMCSTVSVQVNLDAGADDADVRHRWRLLHDLGPVLVAAFANSPAHAGRLTGWRSTRQAVWHRLDPARTAPPPSGHGDIVSTWAEYALDAPVMVVRREGRWLPDPGVTLRQWVTGARAAGGCPTEDDLAYHLTTLFPPVRPRGWFEVRYVDAQPPRWWPVPVAVLTALLDDPAAGEIARAAAAPVAGRWVDAARYGVAAPPLAAAAKTCFHAALGALRRTGADAPLADLVAAYLDTYVARGRSPADDVIDLAHEDRTAHEASQQEEAAV